MQIVTGRLEHGILAGISKDKRWPLDRNRKRNFIGLGSYASGFIGKEISDPI